DCRKTLKPQKSVFITPLFSRGSFLQKCRNWTFSTVSLGAPLWPPPLDRPVPVPPSVGTHVTPWVLVVPGCLWALMFEVTGRPAADFAVCRLPLAREVRRLAAPIVA